MLEAAQAMALASAIKGSNSLLEDAFGQFDANDDQYLNEEEVFEMLEQFGFQPSASDVIDFIEATDLDDDKRISRKEFVRRLSVWFGNKLMPRYVNRWSHPDELLSMGELKLNLV